MFNGPDGSYMLPTILRLPAVRAETGYSRSTLYFYITQGLWTKPVRIGVRAVGWPAAEVAMLITARIAGRSETDIRVLVKELEAGRLKAIASDSGSTGQVAHMSDLRKQRLSGGRNVSKCNGDAND